MNGSPLDIARDFIARGWKPVPIPFRQKGPLLKEWQKLRIDQDTATRHFNGSSQNIGVLMGPPSNGLTDVDLDWPLAGRLAPRFLPATQSRFGRASKPGSHWLFITGLAKTAPRSVIKFADPCEPDRKKATIVELRIGGEGVGEQGAAQTVFPGSVHSEGELIEWEQDGPPASVVGNELRRACGRLAAAALLARHWNPPGDRNEIRMALTGLLIRHGWPVEDTAHFVNAVTVGAGGAEELWQRRSEAGSAMGKLNAGGNLFGLPTLAGHVGDKVAAKAAEWLELDLLARSETQSTLAPEHHETGIGPPAFSDEDLALRFAELHSERLRHVALWSRWLIYDGQRWAHDDTLKGFDIARQVCRAAARECNKEGTAKTLASAKTVAAVASLARSDRRLAATIDQWDSDPWLLNTPAGVVDLRTGEIGPHAPGLYLTKITAASPGGDCPQFRCFLDRVTGGDVELQDFLQRIAGYALTGSTREHALFFFHGTGGNGKGVFINTLAGILADYQRSAPIETFIASNVEHHSTDLAGLRGARLVTATETEEGRRWAEAKLKLLTGGDKISARYMRQDYFDYVPQFKLLIAGNHKPGLRSVDEAIRRRLHLIPFTVTIPPEERDLSLTDRLQAEWPGILQWAIDGCLAWQRQGLNPPHRVRTATAAYLESEDASSAWIDECCERDGWELTARLFASWKAWAERSGEFAGTRKQFREQLENKGFVPVKRAAGAGFSGLKLAPVESDPDAYWKR